jgi:hypothetical protein
MLPCPTSLTASVTLSALEERCTVQVLGLHVVDAVVNGTDCDVNEVKPIDSHTCGGYSEGKVAVVDAPHCDVVTHQRGVVSRGGGKGEHELGQHHAGCGDEVGLVKMLIVVEGESGPFCIGRGHSEVDRFRLSSIDVVVSLPGRRHLS